MQILIVGGRVGRRHGCNETDTALHELSVEVVNADARYPPFSWPLVVPEAGETIAVCRHRKGGAAGHRWADYVEAGVLGALECCMACPPSQGACSESAPSERDLCSLRLAVSGTVPEAAGLSSSSALVCASVLAALTGWGGASPGADALAARAAASERFVGTMGGGMDQAASFLCQRGSALCIHFDPLAGTRVPLPTEAIIVVGNSLERSFKAGCEHPFNVRVIEGRLACVLLATSIGVPASQAPLTLRQVASLLRAWLEQGHDGLATTTADGDDHAIAALADQLLPSGAVTLQQAAVTAGVTVEELESTLLDGRSRAALPGSLHARSLYPRKRARHVLREAQRVRLFVEVCQQQAAGQAGSVGGVARVLESSERRGAEGSAGSAGSVGCGEGVVERLGALMDASHASCRDDYECSSPAVDLLVDAFKKSGAVGARLTGAGWGGCVCALVRRAEAEAVMDAVWQHFYSKRAGTAGAGRVERAAVLFASEPGGGAAVLSACLDHARGLLNGLPHS